MIFKATFAHQMVFLAGPSACKCTDMRGRALSGDHQLGGAWGGGAPPDRNWWEVSLERQAGHKGPVGQADGLEQLHRAAGTTEGF